MDKNIGMRIKLARKAIGMTQDDLAFAAGYKNKSSITKIEAGATDLPTDKINKLAEILGVSPIYLTTGLQPSDDPPLKSWADDLVYTASKLSKQHRIMLVEFAQFLAAIDVRRERQALYGDEGKLCPGDPGYDEVLDGDINA